MHGLFAGQWGFLMKRVGQGTKGVVTHCKVDITRANSITQANTRAEANTKTQANTITWANTVTWANTITHGTFLRSRSSRSRSRNHVF